MTTEVTIESIKEQLESYILVARERSLVMKLQELCKVCQKTAEGIVSEWFTFYASKVTDNIPYLQVLALFERELLGPQTEMNVKARSHGTVNLTDCPSPSIEIISDKVLPLQHYSTSPVLEKFGHLEIRNKKRQRSRKKKTWRATGGSSYNLEIALPVPRLGVIPHDPPYCFGDCDIKWEGSKAEFPLSVYDKETSLDKSYDTSGEDCDFENGVLKKMLTELADALQKQYNVKEWFEPYALCFCDGPCAHEVTAIGLLPCFLMPCKKIPQDLYLYGTEVDWAWNRLDVSKLSKVFLIQGGIVALKGVRSDDTIIVKQILERDIPPRPKCEPTFPPDLDYLQLIVVAGSNSTTGLAFRRDLQQFSALIDYVIEFAPHVLILIGPFSALILQQGKDFELNREAYGDDWRFHWETYDDTFECMIAEIHQKLKRVGTQLVLIPPFDDTSDITYPLPPLVFKRSFPNVHCFSEPCLLNIGGLVVGISPSDVLDDLKEYEVSHGLTDDTDRLCRYILSQHNFLPYYFPRRYHMPRVNYKYVERHARLPVTPHLMILPSELPFFIKDVDGCCFINPGKCSEDERHKYGTLCRIAVKFHENSMPKINAEILLLD